MHLKKYNLSTFIVYTLSLNSKLPVTDARLKPGLTSHGTMLAASSGSIKTFPFRLFMGSLTTSPLLNVMSGRSFKKIRVKQFSFAKTTKINFSTYVHRINNKIYPVRCCYWRLYVIIGDNQIFRLQISYKFVGLSKI